MKALLAICMIVAASLVWADENATVKGKVLEIKNVESYTYLRLMTLGGETWAAINKAPVKKGSMVTIENVSVMNNFESKTLKKTFPTILFGTLAGPDSGAADTPGSAPGSMASPAASAANPHFMGSAYPVFGKKADSGAATTTRASGANARTVAEILSQGSALKDQPVLVRGKVVKYTSGIMGKNWIHLRDGSGYAADNTNDLIVLSANETKIGDTVTATGIVRTNKDVGIGIIYKVVVDEATLQK